MRNLTYLPLKPHPFPSKNTPFIDLLWKPRWGMQIILWLKISIEKPHLFPSKNTPFIHLLWKLRWGLQIILTLKISIEIPHLFPSKTTPFPNFPRNFGAQKNSTGVSTGVLTPDYSAEDAAASMLQKPSEHLLIIIPIRDAPVESAKKLFCSIFSSLICCNSN